VSRCQRGGAQELYMVNKYRHRIVKRVRLKSVELCDVVLSVIMACDEKHVSWRSLTGYGHVSI
jgi:hypothetical protein